VLARGKLFEIVFEMWGGVACILVMNRSYAD
jgi:hypothetical protein